jgi:hypothetical protein
LTLPHWYARFHPCDPLGNAIKKKIIEKESTKILIHQHDQVLYQ